MSSGFILKKIDLKINSKIQNLKEISSYTQFLDFYNTLPENQKKLTVISINAALSFIPIIIIVTMLTLNSSMQSKVKVIDELTSEISNKTSLSSSLNKISFDYINKKDMSNKEKFKNALNSILRRYHIDNKNFRILHFENHLKTGEIEDYQTSIEIKNITTTTFTNVYRDLINRLKIIIQEIKIINMTKENNINVEFSLRFFQKITVSNKEDSNER